MSDQLGWYALARRRAGAMSTEEEAMVDQALSESSTGRELLQQMESDLATYEARQDLHLAALRARIRVEEAARAVPIWRRWLAPALLVASGLAAIAFLVLPGDKPTSDSQDAPSVVGYRGALQIDIRAATPDGVLEVKTGQRLRAGDRLRFVLTTSEAGYVTVFSVDSTQELTPFYPETQDQRPLSLPRAGRHELPESIILDGTVGLEYVMVLWSPAAFKRQDVHRAARQLVLKGGAPAVTADALKMAGHAAVVVIEKVK